MPLTAAFENSFVALLAGLWAELEAVLGAAGVNDDGSSDSRRRAELRAQALLLELVVLADRCDTARWHALIGTPRVGHMRAVVTNVLALLDFSPLEMCSSRSRTAIVHAQNFIFDEVQRATRARAQRAASERPGTACAAVPRSA